MNRSRNIMTIFFTIIALSLSACGTREDRLALNMVATNFGNQANKAIESTQKIYSFQTENEEENTRSNVVKFLAEEKDSNFFEDPGEVDELIRKSLMKSPAPRSFQEELDKVKVEFERAVLMFEKVEYLELWDDSVINKTKQPVQALTVQMMKLAKFIGESPPKPKQTERTKLSLDLQSLKEKYDGTANEEDKQKIKQDMEEVIKKWVKFDIEEDEQICQVLSSIVDTVNSGVQLSVKVDEYVNKRLSLTDLIHEINRGMLLVSDVTGANTSKIRKKINDIDRVLKEYPLANQIINELAGDKLADDWIATVKRDMNKFRCFTSK
jgi:uncharacterized lipoprotein YmbA